MLYKFGIKCEFKQLEIKEFANINYIIYFIRPAKVKRIFFQDNKIFYNFEIWKLQ